jgi:hypothetical protein
MRTVMGACERSIRLPSVAKRPTTSTAFSGTAPSPRPVMVSLGTVL